MFDNHGTMIDHETGQRGIVIVDEALQVKLWNPWLERVSGVDGHRATDMNLADLMPGMRSSGLAGLILDAIYTGRQATVRAHEVSDMAWAYDLNVTIGPVDTRRYPAFSGDAETPLCMVEFDAPGRMAQPYEMPEIQEGPVTDRPRTGKILLLEGDDQYRKAMSALLRDEGFQVCEASDGPAAVRIVQLSETFDLILSDICTDYLGGFDAVMQIRALPSDKGNIPAIALVSDGTIQDRDRLLNAGFSDYFSKLHFKDRLPRICRNFTGSGQGATRSELSHA